MKLRRLDGAPGTTARRPAWRVISSAIAVAITVASCGSDGVGPPEPVATTVQRSIAQLGAEPLVVRGAPWGVAVDAGVVWVSDASRSTVLRIDAATRKVVGELPTGAPDPRDSGLAASGGQVWVANLGGTVGVLDAATGDMVARVTTGDGEPAAVAVDGRWAWVATHGEGGGLVRLDRARPDRDPVAVVLPESGFAVAVAGDRAWVAGLDGRVFAIDAKDATVVGTFDLGGAPRGVAVQDGDVWVSLRDARAVVRLDGDTGKQVARIPLDGQPWPVAVGGGFVWVATLDGRLLRIDPALNEVTGEAQVGPEARGIAVATDRVWVTSQSGVVSSVALD